MPVLSQYWFHNGFFQGPFDVFNEPYPDGGWAWISNGSSSAATLAWNRPDGEHAVDLAAQLNTGDVLAIVDKALGGQASRTSGIMVQGVFWPSVPYYGSDPGRHPASMMLARVYFDFHVPTPWYCSDADGNVAYYLVLYLDASGHARGYVDGWSYNYSAAPVSMTPPHDGHNIFHDMSNSPSRAAWTKAPMVSSSSRPCASA